MKKLIIFFCLPLFVACKQESDNPDTSFNKLAEDYVRLGLFIGQYDEAFIDAYYGPDSLKPKAKGSVFPKDSLLAQVKTLKDKFSSFINDKKNDTLAGRAEWINTQLTAFDRRIRIFAGEYGSFDEESKDLFGVQAPKYDEAHYQTLVSQLDSLLPGKGNRNQRFQALANRFIIPKNKLDTVFKAAIAECRKRTLQHYQLPATENFQLEFVSNKPWNGYNWYKGNYQSVIQINTDLNIFIDRAIDVGSHESYPGHHVYNMLLEKNLYRDKGWVEISMYPLFSPQSIIAEGSANYGIELVFPGNEKIKFASEVLLPLAGVDTAGIALYFKALEIKGRLNYARNEVGRGIVNNIMNEQEAMRWLMEYALFNEETAKKSIAFIKANRSYVINYNYGMDLVRKYMENKTGNDANEAKRWEAFGWLLSNQVQPKDFEQL
jgi:hypothetical protein